MKKLLIVSISLLLVLIFMTKDPQRVFSQTRPEDFGLKEGDMVGILSPDEPDIYIVSASGYKRLFLNPVIFSFYGHLGGFDRVKKIDITARNAFPTSPLVRNCEISDPKVYAIEITGNDDAILHWVNISGQVAVKDDPEFFAKVFCINNKEFSWYPKGGDYQSLADIFEYGIPQPTPPPGLSVDLKVNGSNNPEPVAWNSQVTATWTSAGASYCSGFDELVGIDSGNLSSLPVAGSVNFKARALVPTYFTDITVYLVCLNILGQHADDSVVLKTTIETRPSLDLKNPTASDAVRLGDTYTIVWDSKNIERVNILLHKRSTDPDGIGQFWYIARNIPNTNSYSWQTNLVIPDRYRETYTTNIGAGYYDIMITDELETLFEISDNQIQITN